MKNTFLGTVGFLTACLLPIQATAQSQDEACLDLVAEICAGADANICFDSRANWKSVTPACQGDVQTLIELANEAEAEMQKEGASLGGSVRAGAGTSFEKTGSLSEGTLVSLEENTGVMMNGYPWFKIIQYDNRNGAEILSGYQWGGILCAFDNVAGVHQACPAEWSDNPARLAESGQYGQDPVAPVHGNSDEDNEMIALETVTNCLAEKEAAGVNGSACIGQLSESCLEEGDDTTLAMRQCISLEHSGWDQLLNKNYKQLMASLDSEAKTTKLREAQRHWIKFVTAFCPLGYEFNQGSMYLVSGDQCSMEMTARQALQLSYLNGPEQ